MIAGAGRAPWVTEMDTLLREPETTESFLAWEDGQDGKHEFDGARVIPMTGGSSCWSSRIA